MSKYIFSFGDKKNKKILNSKEILGGKGANLAEMARLGLPVPPGFTISTQMCKIFYENKKKLSAKIYVEIKKELKKIELKTKKKFGDNSNPLLVSVRSGSKASMPGMMDTILNLGLNDKTTEALSKKTSNKRFARDSYRRFIQMYGNVVLGVFSGARVFHRYYFKTNIFNLELLYERLKHLFAFARIFRICSDS